jgi:hypothetical protein
MYLNGRLHGWLTVYLSLAEMNVVDGSVDFFLTPERKQYFVFNTFDDTA